MGPDKRGFPILALQLKRAPEYEPILGRPSMRAGATDRAPERAREKKVLLIQLFIIIAFDSNELLLRHPTLLFGPFFLKNAQTSLGALNNCLYLFRII